MSNDTRTLLTIVTEAVLEPDICEALQELGAAGYTVTNARGSGSRGVRDAGWSSSGRVIRSVGSMPLWTTCTRSGASCRRRAWLVVQREYSRRGSLQ